MAETNLEITPRDQARLLVTAGLAGTLSPAKVESILDAAANSDGKRDPFEVLLTSGPDVVDAFYKFLAQALGVDYVDLTGIAETLSPVVELGEEDLAALERHQVIIYTDVTSDISLAVCASPADLYARRTAKAVVDSRNKKVGSTSGQLAEPAVALGRPDHIARELARLRTTVIARQLNEAAAVSVDTTDDQSLDGIVVSEVSPVVRWVNNLLQQSIVQRASDIHINPVGQHTVAKFRIDGVLQDADSPPQGRELEVVAHIMHRAGMDPTNQRFPQDGRLSFSAQGRVIDGRVGSIPSILGPKITIRLLDKTNITSITLDQMGFSERALLVLRRNASKRQGAILVSGPTGSGKTTTLYSVLREIATPDKHVMTVEDPVEYQLPGLIQVQVARSAEQGATFASALRAMLRADPDVIMVGEIRDAETARTAADASITGHLVLSTVHAPSAAEVYTRIIEMGVPAYAVAEAILVTTAQRLIRRVCQRCAEFSSPTDDEKRELERAGVEDIPQELAHARGCSACNGGYTGRTVIAEVLESNSDIRHLVASGAPAYKIRDAAAEEGFVSLAQDALRHVLEGRTTVTEWIRSVDVAR